MSTSFKHKAKQGVFTLLTKTLGDKDGLVRLQTLSGPAKGLRFGLDLQREIEASYLIGSYELPTTRRLAHICREGWVVWDCGVYIGYYTNLFAKLVGPAGKVIGFEPDPRNLSRAQANIKANKFRNTQFVQAAIGGTSGEVGFILSDNTNSHLPGVYVGGTSEGYKQIERQDSIARVRCMTLDEIYLQGDIPQPDLIKVDIEGAEKDAVQHMKYLTSHKKPLIILELHNPECDAVAWEFAQAAKYSLQSMDTGQPIHHAADVHGTLLCTPLR